MPDNIGALLLQLPFVAVVIWVFFEIEKRFSKYIQLLFNQLERIGNKIDKLGTVTLLVMARDKLTVEDMQEFIREYYDCEPNKTDK